jgi:hypothetical protein
MKRRLSFYFCDPAVAAAMSHASKVRFGREQGDYEEIATRFRDDDARDERRRRALADGEAIICEVLA